MAFLQDIKYTAKMIRGILSGCDGLQRKASDDEWEYIEYSQREERNYAGEYSVGITYDLPDYPYYVCVAWKNHTHTPLPIIIDAESEYAIQNATVHFLHWLWAKTPFCPRSFCDAVINCAYYEQQFSEKNSSALEPA